jgi:hypothetical protein
MGVWRVVKKIVIAPVTLPVKGYKKAKEKAMLGVIAGVVRHVLTAAGGGLVAEGSLAQSDLNAGIGAVLTVIGIAWSVMEKKKQARKGAVTQ